jgi:two-component system nitrate/nitrite response regulator NarL
MTFSDQEARTIDSAAMHNYRARRGTVSPLPTPNGRIRVLTGDAQPLFRDAVSRVVRQRTDFDLVGEVGDGCDALAAIQRLQPDVAVLDVELPSLDGRRILNAVARDGLATRIVLLLRSVPSNLAFDAIEDGAAGCLTKDASAEQLCEAVTTAARGETFMCRRVQSGVAREIRLRRRHDRPVLSEREGEVLRRIAAGESAPAIARAMHLSSATIKTHIGHLYEKLGVSERAAAVAEAMRRGLLE